ncbi:hypothetical protein KZ774_08700 [Escherichia coli]|nr:hypothetical protein [Escherichia coli]
MKQWVYQEKCMVWFPKLYGNSDWGNELTDDGNKIIERNIKDDEGYTERWDKRIVMAHSRDELNRTLYRFLGVFEAIPWSPYWQHTRVSSCKYIGQCIPS